MKVLVVGSGAREHALVWKCVQSDLVERVYCAPGNGGTGGMARNVPIGAADVVRLVDFAKRERLGLVVLGPRSEEHTSELQSRFDLVCRLLLEKKNID